MKPKTPKDPMELKSIGEVAEWVNDNLGAIESYFSEETEKRLQDKVAQFLLMWISKECRTDSVKHIARKIGYNDSPIFFAKRKKARLVSEIVFIHAAIAIFAVNHFMTAKAKPIIDAYLALAREAIYAPLEKVDKGFKEKYEKRLPAYFEDLRRDNNPLLGVSHTFLSSLGISPIRSMAAQVFIAEHIGSKLQELGEILKAEQPPTKEIQRTNTNTWTWDSLPEEVKSRFQPPPERNAFQRSEAYEEALGYWRSRVGRNISLVMQQRGRVATTNQESTTKISSRQREEKSADQSPGELLNEKGNELARQGRLSEAVTFYSKAALIEPDYATPIYNRGKAKLNLGDFPGAISDFDIAIKLDSRNADYYNNRAIAKRKAGLLIEAAGDYTEALQLDPTLYRVYLNRGVTYYELGNTVAACSDFSVAKRNGVPGAEDALKKAGCI